MSSTTPDGDAVEAEPAPVPMVPANGDGPPPRPEEAGLEVLAEAEQPEEPEAVELEAEPEFVAGGEPHEAEAVELEAEPEVAAEGEPEEPEAVELEAGPEAVDEHGPMSDPLVTPPEMSQMLFVDVVLLLPATHPVVVLQEADPPYRELRIPVGGAEGIAIGYAARGLATPRPLTHELVTHILEEFGMTLDVVRITAVRGTAFTAEMVISGRLGARVIDCRPSDGIALALRHRLPVPIMASPIVLTRAGSDPTGSN